MKLSSVVMDSQSIQRSLKRISHEIIEKNGGVKRLCIIGVQKKGDWIARELHRILETLEDTSIPLGSIDITPHRDDERSSREVNRTDIGFSIEGKTIVLADDVLYTGRSIRAAIEAIFQLGRPASIQLAVLVDRGHRELPIRPDFVGKNIPTSQKEKIVVNLGSDSQTDNVSIYK